MQRSSQEYDKQKGQRCAGCAGSEIAVWPRIDNIITWEKAGILSGHARSGSTDRTHLESPLCVSPWKDIRVEIASFVVNTSGKSREMAFRALFPAAPFGGLGWESSQFPQTHWLLNVL
jgi:hypothetical protein